MARIRMSTFPKQLLDWDAADYDAALRRLGRMRQQQRKQAKATGCCNKAAVRMLRSLLLVALMASSVGIAALFTFLLHDGPYTAITARVLVLDYPCSGSGSTPSTGLLTASVPGIGVLSPSVRIPGHEERNLSAYLKRGQGAVDSLAFFDFVGTQNGTVQRYVHLSSFHIMMSLFPVLPLYHTNAIVLSGGVLSTSLLHVRVLPKNTCSEQAVWPRGLEASAYLIQQASGATVHLVEPAAPQEPYACVLEGVMPTAASGARRTALQVSSGAYERCRSHAEHYTEELPRTAVIAFFILNGECYAVAHSWACYAVAHSGACYAVAQGRATP